MNEFVSKEKEYIESLEKQIFAAQNMLAFVLLEIGEPVVITRKTMARGIPEDAKIKLHEDMRADCLVISLMKEVNDDTNI